MHCMEGHFVPCPDPRDDSSNNEAKNIALSCHERFDLPGHLYARRTGSEENRTVYRA